MTENASAKTPPRAPPPPGWRWKRRRTPRKPRSFHDDFPTFALKVRFIFGALLVLLALAAMFVLPAAVYLMQQAGVVSGSMEFFWLEVLGTGLGVVLVYVVYLVQPFAGQRRKKPAPAADADAPKAPQ